MGKRKYSIKIPDKCPFCGCPEIRVEYGPEITETYVNGKLVKRIRVATEPHIICGNSGEGCDDLLSDWGFKNGEIKVTKTIKR